MSIETTLYALLASTGAVTAIVSTRIYPNILPQGGTLPAITYQRVSADRLNHLGGANAKTRYVIQVDSWAEDYDTVKDLANKVRAAVVAGASVAAAYSDIDIYDTQAELHRVSAEFSIFHTEG